MLVTMGGEDPGVLDALVEAAAGGDPEALAGLYRELNPALVGFLRGMAPGEAEDLAADAWIDAAASLPRLEGDGAGFRRLLFTIARRRAIDHLRKRHRRRTDPVPSVPAVAAGGDVAEKVAEMEDARAAIERIFFLLPRPQAEVIVLRVVGGLAVADVARIVGRSPAAVSVLQSRGLRRLAAKIERPPRRRAQFRPSRRGVQDPAIVERWVR
jgi:RNA polymerase sigma-70 factor (ECF subfamily)